VRALRGEEAKEMKKFIFIAAFMGLAIVVLRRFGAALGQRAMTKCQEMMARHEGQPGERPRADLSEPGDLTSTPA
jgi:hypothetical protein